MSLSTLADYHMHTPLCKHCTGAPWEYVQSAIDRGLAEIGFSDHCPMPDWYDPDFRMSLAEMPTYRRIVDDARKRYPDFPVRFGLEADFHPGTERFVEELIRGNDFDYVIGSVHYIHDWGFDNPDLISRFHDRPISEIWAQYFHLWEQAARSGLFDIMAHPDLVKKFGHRPEGDLAEYYRPGLEACMRYGVAIEVSTAGLRKPVGEIYPSAEFLRLAHQYGVPIVISSDAHHPGEVGQDFEKAVDWARQAGYTQTCRFEKRLRRMVDL
ncbi:MAG: histidinol-phosphatase HisJ family protein [Verrucomicrobiae bacterium]|nr:histidinol-phosphatase HisJ family protein [Verrucomicrobiae bacterium]